MGEWVRETDRILESNRPLFRGTLAAARKSLHSYISMAKRRNGFTDRTLSSKGHGFGYDFNSCIHGSQEINVFLSIGISKSKDAKKIQQKGVVDVRSDKS